MACGFGLLMVGPMAVLVRVSALGVGTAGVIQRRSKRLFVFPGVTCGILVLALILAQQRVVALRQATRDPAFWACSRRGRVAEGLEAGV